VEEELEPLWLAALLLRVQEAFGRYISLHSARPDVTDRIGQYQPQVPGAEFGFGVRWRLALKLSIEEENVGRLGAFASQVCVPSLYVCVFATRMQRLDSLDCCRITHSCTHTSDV
jgi:hypothetical protein